MKLYEIDAAILECIDTETGEICDFERLEELQIARDAKLENVALYVKQLTAEAEALAAEEKALKERKHAKQVKAARYAEWLAHALEGKPFETARVRLSFRKSDPVEITDELAVLFYCEKHNLEHCIKYKTPEVSVSEIKKLLKAGQEIPGAALTEKQNLQIK